MIEDPASGIPHPRSPGTRDDPWHRQAAANASSRSQWEGFVGHRAKVSALLGGGGASGVRGRLCVLGAGNTNDLDLPALLEAHREVHLVDLDAESMALGADRQGVADHPGLRLHAGLDLTGMLDRVATWTRHAEVAEADLDALASWPAARVPLALPGPFDRVGSTCLLSQLIGSAFCALGDDHPRFKAVVRAIRAGHLRLLAKLAGQGGGAVLITDVVSTEAYPPLAGVPEGALPGLLPTLAREKAYFHGLHPSGLLAALRGDPELSGRLAAVDASRPWLWDLHARRYLVWAMSYRLGAGGSR